MILTRCETIVTLKPTELRQLSEWTRAARPRASFDLTILGYPRCTILIAEDAKGPLAYLPVQTTIMAEDFIPRPDSTNRQRAASLGKFDELLMRTAKRMNIADVYTFIPNSEADYATKVQRHDWVEIPFVRLFAKHAGVFAGNK